jgi:hypothetical protein
MGKNLIQKDYLKKFLIHNRTSTRNIFLAPLFFVSASLYIVTTITIYLFTDIRQFDSIEEVSES